MPPRKNRHAKAGKSKKKTLLWTLAIILLLIIGGLVYYFTSIYNQLDNMHKTGEDSPWANVPTASAEAVPPPQWEGTEPVNILLMGVDARGVKKGEVPRSDTMLVASLDPVKKKFYVFSILRDTFVPIPDHGSQRINAAITYGPNTAMQTVSDLLGIPIQYYVYTDFQGFMKLVDAVGGVDYEVEKDMRYTTKADGPEFDINLKKGFQHLDGKMALQYVRFRHDATSDFTRTERQRGFLKAVADKVISTTSIVKLPTILSEVTPYIDTNIVVSDMLKLGALGYDSSMGGSAQIPPMHLIREKTTKDGSQVIGFSSERDLKAFVQDTLTAPDPTPTPAPDAEASPGSSPSATPGSK
ncbi:LCP family protein [Paenibacillus tritici]|jgi:polyisoprenyl-teichoic acid--peptidoglycan teichoic acid transferase|uniref:LCP family protein n=1 Tax=Paenibacillus tritici TaxID=1873425 RepID=UPI001BA971A5|nr:LCP family protein [Paenibacillus tritici]QUL55579.1 LCP family protein [Paenibacillus tritici]